MLHISAGCHLVQTKTESTEELTGYLGESVVLPCSCTEPLAKPEQIKWRFNIESINYEEIYPSEHIERYKNRGKLLNQTTPGNLSLHLSSLTKEDQGDYQCSVSNRFIFIRLHVKEQPKVYSSTYQPSQQTHKLITTQQPEDRSTHQPYGIPLYVILMPGFASVLLLALPVFIYWRYKGHKKTKKVNSEAPKLKRKLDNEDEVEYSSVFLVKTASTPAVMKKDAVEDTEYASINVK
ncbi:uncharacterized protein [Paramisgurnus dabryanus]|uniref:uncharacterized protein n=1 Tax=Paramisgurnus dabryanus TaxID=90735 RepID=UPI0031F395EC